MSTPEKLEQLSRHFALASMVTVYPDDDIVRTLCTQDDENAPAWLAADLVDHVRSLGTEDGLLAARALYIDLFDRGKAGVSLYETEYGHMRGLSKGRDLADISGFYRAFGLELDETNGHEMLDHIGIELEFYSLMLLKLACLIRVQDEQGAEVVQDACKKFLRDHLGGFAKGLLAKKGLGDEPVWGNVITWCCRLVEKECERLGVNASPLSYAQDPETKDAMDCGGVRLPVVPS